MMDFRDYAAKETSELAARLSEAAAAAAEDAARQVEEQAARAAEQAAQAAEQAVQAAEQAAQHARDEAQKVADALRAELQAAGDQKAAVSASLQEAQAQVERLRGDLRSTTERVEAAGRQLDEARKTAEKLEAARTELASARDEQAAARRTAETDLRKMRETAEALRTDLGGATRALEKATAERLAADEAAAAAHSQSQAAEVKLAAVTDLLKKNAARVKTLEQAHQAYERKIHDLEAALQNSRSSSSAAPSAGLDDLLAGFQALGAATTIGDVLTTLVEQMAGQFPRVALFRLKKGHLQGEHQIGFDLKNDIGNLVLPLGMDSLPARAASSGQVENLSGEELKKSKTPFSGTPAHAVAFPLVVADETLAVVYADDSGAQPKKAAPADAAHAVQRAEAMRQFAVSVLLRLANELKALAELQKYAASLLHEMEQMYDADAESGLPAADLQKRLAGNLDYARSIYGSRTALESADAATLIEEEIGSLIQARQGTPFARDLELAAGHLPARSAAEAS
jgi:predicted  nucleic acid-binding Zn-ribbon protein